MKTQRELNLHYWGFIHEMVEAYNKEHGADVKPWKCVKHTGRSYFKSAPLFEGTPECYEFAVAILYDEQAEVHRAIFPGDELFYLGGKVKAKDFCNGVLTFENGEAASLIYGFIEWNPTKPKRTFEINGVELPCPVKQETDHYFEFGDSKFYYETEAQCWQVTLCLEKQFSNARNKE